MTGRRGGLAGIALLLFALTPALGAQETRCDEGDTEVRRLSFAGNSAFNDATLAIGIVTTPSTLMRRALRVFGGKRCLDRSEFPVDVARLRLWYRNHGFLDATVDTVVTVLRQRVIAVRFQIHEGEPVLIDSLVVAGLDSVPERAEILADLPLQVGFRFDRYAMTATRDTIARRLRDTGYPDAVAFRAYDLRGAARRATLRFTAEPGPRRRIGAVAITRRGRDGGEPEVPEASVQRLTGLEVGELYRERLLERAKRTLYQSEAFAQVDVTPLAVPGDSSLTVAVDVTEGYLRSARLGGGWGTLDCFRATGELTEQNLFRSATRLELRGRLSKIGIGAPLAGTEALCAKDVVADPYSRVLNYYGSATFSRASLLRATFIPTLSLYSETRSEFNAFLRTTPIGASLGLTRSMTRRTLSLGYSIEYGKTEAQPALFCALFNACVRADREPLQERLWLAVVSVASSYERTDNALDPTLGVVGRAEVRYASRYVGADPNLQFGRINLDGSTYVPLGRELVLATRLRLGAVLSPRFAFAETDVFVPAQERLFGGGGTTVRGFRQNELGPLLYIPTDFEVVYVAGAAPGIDVGDTVYYRANSDSVGQRAVPTGGNALIVANVELRFVSPFLSDLLRWTVFADIGEVWNQSAAARRLRFSTLKVTPGIGFRLRTPIGYLRADIAYNPYPRASGAAYFDAPVTTGGGGGALYCVSPGNTLPIALDAGGRLVQAEGTCPGSYLPRGSTSFLSRLTPTIAIGHAF